MAALLLSAATVGIGPVLLVPAQTLPEEVALETNGTVVFGDPGVRMGPTEATAMATS